MLLAAGVAGVMGLFLPLVQLERGKLVVGFTAKDLSFGMERTRAVIDKQLPRLVEKRLSRLHETREDLQLVLDASRWAAGAFVPGILLGLLGAVGAIRKRAGRWLGALAVPLGLASIGAWFGLRYAMQVAAEEAGLGKIEVGLQLGAHALLVIGGLGLIAGLGALIQPDGRPRATPTTSGRA